MTIPLYNQRDMQKDFGGDDRAQDFSILVSETIENRRFDDDVQKSILTEAQEKGTQGLSTNKINVLASLFKDYDAKCQICSEVIPFSDMDIGGGNRYCSNCGNR